MCLLAMDTASPQGISMKKKVPHIKAWPVLKTQKKMKPLKIWRPKIWKSWLIEIKTIMLFFCQMALTIITKSIFQIKDKNSQASLTSTSIFFKCLVHYSNHNNTDLTLLWYGNNDKDKEQRKNFRPLNVFFFLKDRKQVEPQVDYIITVLKSKFLQAFYFVTGKT